MPRNQTIHEQSAFAAAKQLINRDNYSIRKAAKETGIPYTTLRDHINGTYAGYVTQFGPERIVKPEEEKSLVSYVKYMASRGLPLTRSDIKRFAGDIIKQRNPCLKVPSDKWVYAFLKRNPDLSLRKAHALQRDRVAVSQDIIDEYFSLLKRTIDNLSLDRCTIYNCDESGFSGAINNSKKVVVPKGTRHAYQAMVNISGHITMLNAISAAGETLPPLLIFSQTLPRNCGDGVPDSWVFKSTESGYINSELFVEWFQLCFVPYIGARRPVLLILDNHASHVSKAFVDAARENSVDLLYIPAHTSHLVQPQDAGYFHIVKQYVGELAIQLGYLGIKSLSRSLFPKILHQALNRITGLSVSNAFKCTGVAPFNPGAVKALLPSSATPTAESCQTSVPSTSTVASSGVTNNLVKLGIVSEELANILLEPTSNVPVQQPRRKNYKRARAVLSSSTEPDQNPKQVCIDKNNFKVGQVLVSTAIDDQPTADDDKVLCQVCMVSTRPGFYWVGCDFCECWFHYECLPSIVQTDVDLSLVTKSSWCCNKCTEE